MSRTVYFQNSFCLFSSAFSRKLFSALGIKKQKITFFFHQICFYQWPYFDLLGCWNYLNLDFFSVISNSLVFFLSFDKPSDLKLINQNKKKLNNIETTSCRINQKKEYDNWELAHLYSFIGLQIIDSPPDINKKNPSVH